MTGPENLQWAKQRALMYVDNGRLAEAFTSFCSDLSKCDENKGRYPSELMLIGLLKAAADDREGLRDWISGFAS